MGSDRFCAALCGLALRLEVLVIVMGMVLVACKTEGCLVKVDHESGYCSRHRADPAAKPPEIVLKTTVIDVGKEPERAAELINRVVEPHPEPKFEADPVAQAPSVKETCWCGNYKHHRGRHRNTPQGSPRFSLTRWYRWRRTLIATNMCSKDDDKGLKIGVFLLAALHLGTSDAELLAEVCRLSQAEVKTYRANMLRNGAWTKDGKWIVDNDWDSYGTDHRTVQFALWMLVADNQVVRVSAAAKGA